MFFQDNLPKEILFSPELHCIDKQHKIYPTSEYHSTQTTAVMNNTQTTAVINNTMPYWVLYRPTNISMQPNVLHKITQKQNLEVYQYLLYLKVCWCSLQNKHLSLNKLV